jgi:GntR family transcriptional regulator
MSGSPDKPLRLDRLSESSGVPFSQQIRDQIAAAIGTGRLAPGAPLPSIRELAADTLVSVITVKKAYEELEHMGLVYSRQGRGTFVAESGAGAARDKARVDALVELEAAVGRAAAAGVTRPELEAAFLEVVRRRYPG